MSKKKTQKMVIVILIVAAVLGIGGIAVAYYISTQAEQEILLPKSQGQYCAYIVAYTTPQCNSCDCTYIETQTLESRIAPVVNGQCTIDQTELQLPLEPEAPAYDPDFDIAYPGDLAIDTQPAVINCLIANTKYSSCESLTVRDSEEKELLTPPIAVDDPVAVDALFTPEAGEEFYKFQFTINGEVIEVLEEDIKKEISGETTRFRPQIAYSNFKQANTLTVSANAFSNLHPEGVSQSKYCYKQYTLATGLPPACSSVEANIKRNTTTIDNLKIRVTNIKNSDEIKLMFSFDKEFENFNMETIPQELLEVFLVNNSLNIEKEYLYPTGEYKELYSNTQGFPALDLDSEEKVRMNVAMYVNEEFIDSSLCYTHLSVQLDTTEPQPDPTPDPLIPKRRLKKKKSWKKIKMNYLKQGF